MHEKRSAHVSATVKKTVAARAVWGRCPERAQGWPVSPITAFAPSVQNSTQEKKKAKTVLAL